MLKLADKYDLGSYAVMHEGSNPSSPTLNTIENDMTNKTDL